MTKPLQVYLPLCVTVVAAAAALGAMAAHQNGVAMVVGTLVGAAFFLRGGLRGGGLGNARSFGQKNPDINMRVGVCHAATAVAAVALAHDPPYPAAFRTFYWCCAIGAAVLAMALHVLSLRRGNR